MKLPIAETFISIQGEGTNVGMYAFFVRSFGCNLRCAWCDTKQSYGKNRFSLYTVDDVASMIKNSPVKTIILTGGEPAIYHDFFSSLIDMAPADYFMETNGTIRIGDLIDKLKFISISPKLNSSQEYYDMNIIKEFVSYSADGEMKFVIGNSKDLDDAVKITKLVLGIREDLPIVIQPAELTNYTEEIKAIYKMVFENQYLSTLKNLRFIPQVNKLCKLK